MSRPRDIQPPGMWTENAACAYVDPEIINFFPENPNDASIAKAICIDCKVQKQCLGYALENDIVHGIWGGMTKDERNGLKRKISKRALQELVSSLKNKNN